MVPESRRGHGKFEVLTKANDLAVYTIRIASNPKTFDLKYQTALANDIISTAKDIYIKCKTANDIRVGEDVYKAQMRKRLQESAIMDCNSLLALMDMAKRVYHLSAKRIRYWGKKTVEVRDMVRRWKDSDSKRYPTK